MLTQQCTQSSSVYRASRLALTTLLLGVPLAGCSSTPAGSTDVGIGPLTIAPGAEKVQCVTVRMNNPEAAFVRRFATDLAPGSHHMIVYLSTETQEAPTPVDCRSFAGILTGSHPIFIAQQPHSELVFPTDNGVPVGLQIEKNQMVQVEMHYINATAASLDVSGKLLADTVPVTANVIASSLAFWGATQFVLPPNAMTDTGVKFQAALAGTKSFALTTHQHQLGTEMKVWYASSATDLSTPVADGTNWANPPLMMFSPPLDFPSQSGASPKGFAFECKWNNTTANTVQQGEHFNDEMCFLWHYYYPSQGFQLCTEEGCRQMR